MTRLLAVTIFSLLLAASATALPQTGPVRVNDIVVLNGTAGLQVDPVGGFNDTTRDPAWQSAYIEALKRSHLDNAIYERSPSQSDDGDENYGGFPPLLSKRQTRPQACV